MILKIYKLFDRSRANLKANPCKIQPNISSWKLSPCIISKIPIHKIKTTQNMYKTLPGKLNPVKILKNTLQIETYIIINIIIFVQS